MIKSNYITFAITHAPTEEDTKGQKAKYVIVLNSTVALVPARKYVFVLISANARTGRRGEGGEEANSTVLDAYSRDVLEQNDNLLLGFEEISKLTLLNIFVSTSQIGVSYIVQLPTVARGNHV